MIGTGWWADMRTAQARLMDSSLFRQINLPLSIFPARPLHRLTESMTKGLSLVVTSMLPGSPTDSWLASEAHRRQMRRARKRKRSLRRRGSRRSTRRPRHGEVQCRRAELSIGGLRYRPCDDPGLAGTPETGEWARVHSLSLRLLTSAVLVSIGKSDQ